MVFFLRTPIDQDPLCCFSPLHSLRKVGIGSELTSAANPSLSDFLYASVRSQTASNQSQTDLVHLTLNAMGFVLTATEVRTEDDYGGPQVISWHPTVL